MARARSPTSSDADAVCLDLRCNTTAGSTSSGITHAGIGLRKQSGVSTTNDFGIEGMAATSSPGVEQLVGNGAGGLNPGSTNGSGDGSVPLKVGSLPWSALMIRRSAAVSASSSSGSLSSKHSIFCVVLDTGCAETVFAADKVLRLGLRYEAQDGSHPIRRVGGGIEFVFTKRVDCN